LCSRWLAIEWSAGTGLVKKTLAAILQKSATPLANCVLVKAELDSHILAAGLADDALMGADGRVSKKS